MTNTAHNQLAQKQAVVIEKRIQANDGVFFRRFPDVYRPRARKRIKFSKDSPAMAGASPQQGCIAKELALKDSKDTAHDKITTPEQPGGRDTGEVAGRSSLLTPVEARFDSLVPTTVRRNTKAPSG